jgi:hypothetical protein
MLADRRNYSNVTAVDVSDAVLESWEVDEVAAIRRLLLARHALLQSGNGGTSLIGSQHLREADVEQEPGTKHDHRVCHALADSSNRVQACRNHRSWLIWEAMRPSGKQVVFVGVFFGGILRSRPTELVLLRIVSSSWHCPLSFLRLVYIR